ncbi:MAG: aldehyde dehydrogenase [Bacillota bacterium]|jgi:aldehyde dehydrogenase (NAD+)|nr:aldehyde dehydrogenase [Bacillota bacterium]
MKNKELITRQRDFFYTGKTLPINERINNLKKLRQAILSYEDNIAKALYEDLGKCQFEAYETEIGVTLHELSHMIAKLPRYARAKRLPTHLTHFPSKSRLYRDPYGLVLIVAPWNYPFHLAIMPLIGAIAGGNCTVVKTSATAPASSALIKEMLSSVFPEEYITVVEGKEEGSRDLPDEKFDFIFFTGSVNVGRHIMERASKNLTPVVLELGGKSPCIVDETADLALTAKRIIWGKSINSGQTCVAPDYVLVHSRVKDALIREMKKVIPLLFGEDMISNKDVPKIVNQHHFDRLTKLIETGDVVYGGRNNPINRKIETTIIDNVTWDCPLMQEELFGPILPILTYDNREEMLSFMAKREKPLALYLFTQSKAMENLVTSRLSYGGGCINDTIMHVANNNIPFGGVGTSGMGNYHGKRSFETFTHPKGIVKRAKRLDLPLRYPPYDGERKMKILRMFLK